MTTFVQAITHLWRYRGRLLFCVITLPLLAYLYGLNKVESYIATTTLYINPNLVTSPLLQDMSPNEHRAILARKLAGPEVLTPSLEQTGLLLPGTSPQGHSQRLADLQARLRLNTLSDHLLQIKLKLNNRESILPLLEAISFNYRDQLLAGEKFSDQVSLAALKNDVLQLQSNLSAAETASGSSFNTDAVAKLKIALATAESELKAQSRKAQLGNAAAAVRVIEAPTLVAQPQAPTASLIYISAMLGLLIGLALVWLAYRFDATLRSDEDIQHKLQLRVLGRMPDFGKLHVMNGRLTT